MESIVGIVVLGCILIVAHFTQVTAQQLKLMNGKMDDLLKVSKAK
jgi:hypothetical protein